MIRKKILITGVNGYIGNCLFHFLKGKFKVVGIDKESVSKNTIYRCNILNTKKLEQILYKTKPEIVIHLAAQSLVDETINKEKYYNNNVVATNRLLKSMKKNNVNKIIFSSTAAVYKHIPVYYPKDVGAVGGIVGMIGGLGGFTLPICFGIMNDFIGVFTSCFMLLFAITGIALVWMHVSILIMEKDIVKSKFLPELGRAKILSTVDEAIENTQIQFKKLKKIRKTIK